MTEVNKIFFWIYFSPQKTFYIVTEKCQRNRWQLWKQLSKHRMLIWRRNLTIYTKVKGGFLHFQRTNCVWFGVVLETRAMQVMFHSVPSILLCGKRKTCHSNWIIYHFSIVHVFGKKLMYNIHLPLTTKHKVKGFRDQYKLDSHNRYQFNSSE